MDTDQIATQVDEGQFRLVLKEGSLFDIDALEAGVLEASYATMRDALGRALEQASREKATEMCGQKGGPAEWSSTGVSTESMGK